MRAAIWRILKKVIFLSDAEFAHSVVLRWIRFSMRLGNLPLRLVSGWDGRKNSAPSVNVFGMPFLSRVGIAAGFDKDAEVLPGLDALGFGFAEIGTVTPRPQPGNPRPRLFRDPARQALFNRMGFNGEGAKKVAQNLAKARPELPKYFRVGVNVGKNKDTPLERAASDYAAASVPFEGLADYFVINVSSPNTPGLRSLQTVDHLRPIVEEVNHVISRWKSRPPLLLKLAPEVQGDALASIMKAAETWGVDGWVLTNTLGGKWTLKDSTELQGGWSGGVLTKLALERLIEARKLTQKPIISVGGILTPADAQARIQAGAQLVQLYSGWIFNGPSFPPEVARSLSVR